MTTIQKANDDNFQQIIAKGLVIVDFYADWCGPCRMLTPVLEKLSTELSGKAHFIKVDVDKSPKTASSFQITSIPTLIFFKNGQKVHQIVGLKNEDALRTEISQYM